jgi:hypothetical protein
MDFILTPKYRRAFTRALEPEPYRTLTDNFNTIESYVYIISKIFQPFSKNSVPMHLIKIGYSNMKTSTGIPKGYSRLLGFKTSLISFDVHRIYTYETDLFGSKKNKGDSVQAHRAELSLHELITTKFNPRVLRIEFSNGNASEWFDVPEIQLDSFLSFCDDAIYNKIFPNVLSGTYFKAKGSGLIKEITKNKNTQIPSKIIRTIRTTRSGLTNIPSIIIEPKVIGLEKTKTGLITTKINARQVNKHSSKHALSQSQRIAMDDQMNRKKIKEH